MATQAERGLAIPELRHSLEQIRAFVAKGATSEALQQIDAALQDLDPERLVTIAEASEVLQIRSHLIVELVLRGEGVALQRHGEELLVPLGEIERIYDNERVRGIRASDRAHDEIADFGPPDGLTEEQLDELQRSRPGVLPWERQ